MPLIEDLREITSLADRIVAGRDAYDGLPSNDELDEIIAKLERIEELKNAAE